jgi:hypothetical protein
MEDSPGIGEKVQAVTQMGRLELVSEWQAQFGAPPPPKLRTELMRPVLVYRIQENAYGVTGRELSQLPPPHQLTSAVIEIGISCGSARRTSRRTAA